MGGCASDACAHDGEGSHRSKLTLIDVDHRQLEFDSNIGSSLLSSGFKDEIGDLFLQMQSFSVKISDPLHLEEANRIRNSYIQRYGELERQPQYDLKFGNNNHGSHFYTNEKGSNLYYGIVYRGTPHGWGELYTSRGIIIIGYFEDGIPHYYGKIKYSNDSLYVGGIHRKLRDGYGTLTNRFGEVREGVWRFNLLNGFGTIRNHSGQVAFAGEFIDGKPAKSVLVNPHEADFHMEDNVTQGQSNSQTSLPVEHHVNSNPKRSILKNSFSQRRASEQKTPGSNQHHTKYSEHGGTIRFSDDLESRQPHDPSSRGREPPR